MYYQSPELYSISICQPWEPRLNPLPFAEVMKAMSMTEVKKEHYPWNQCIEDQKKDGHSQESAEKICERSAPSRRVLVKPRTLASSMIHPTTDGKYPG